MTEFFRSCHFNVISYENIDRCRYTSCDRRVSVWYWLIPYVNSDSLDRRVRSIHKVSYYCGSFQSLLKCSESESLDTTTEKPELCRCPRPRTPPTTNPHTQKMSYLSSLYWGCMSEWHVLYLTVMQEVAFGSQIRMSDAGSTTMTEISSSFRHFRPFTINLVKDPWDCDAIQTFRNGNDIAESVVWVH